MSKDKPPKGEDCGAPIGRVRLRNIGQPSGAPHRAQAAPALAQPETLAAIYFRPRRRPYLLVPPRANAKRIGPGMFQVGRSANIGSQRLIPSPAGGVQGLCRPKEELGPVFSTGTSAHSNPWPIYTDGLQLRVLMDEGWRSVTQRREAVDIAEIRRAPKWERGRLICA